MRVICLAATLVLAGCVDMFGGDDGGDGPSGDEFHLFLAAIGSGNVAVTLDLAQVALDGPNRTARPLTLTTAEVDLGELADSGDAVEVASGPVTGTVVEILVGFRSVTINGAGVPPGMLRVNHSFPVEGGEEATITIDLDDSLNGTEFIATPETLVVERDGEVVSQARLDRPVVVPPRPMQAPEVSVGGTVVDILRVPSGSTFNASASVPGEDPGGVEFFWNFGDGNTASGATVAHTYRDPGAFRIDLIAHGGPGRQVTTNVTVDSYTNLTDSGNLPVSSGGEDLVADRDYKEHTVDVPGEPVSATLFLVVQSWGGQGLPVDPGANVFVTVFDAADEVVGEDTTDANPKVVPLTADLLGTLRLRVSGDSGSSIGYAYGLELHYVP